jgi:predicted DNA-binding transcriptional regulator YafY
MRADRLLSAILLLQAHGKQTGRELAARLRVSERTVHRDMDALSAAGVPVFAVRGVYGGWQLDNGWRAQVPSFDEAELRALLMAQPRVIGDRRLAEAADRALQKLMAALPVSLRERAASIKQRLHVDTTAWHGGAEMLDFLPVVQEAVSNDRKLAMCYMRATGDEVDRTIDPLGLVAKGVTWYLVADTPAGLRTYRVSRIRSARVLATPSVRPPGFDLPAYWASSTARFLESRSRYQATLRLTAGAAARLKTWHMCGTAAADPTPDAEGWVTLRVHFEDEEQALFIVLGLASRARVLEPASLRERVATELAAQMQPAFA